MAQSNGGVICLLAWASASVSHPPEKRAVALALINCVGQFGNILGSYVLAALSQRFKQPFNCFFVFFFPDISGLYPGDLRIIYLILSA